MDNMDEETLLAKAAEIQKARADIKARAREEERRKEKEAKFKGFVEKVKPFLGITTVIEGAVEENADDNCGKWYVEEFNEYLDTLPILGYAPLWDKNCILRIKVEVIGPTEEEEE